ncbi:hypothetical protein GCM10027168_19940 [Streptomyces capparidis]
MGDVLHLQTRAYPLHYSSSDGGVRSVPVPGHGELRPVPGELGSLVYNPDPTIEIDLTGIARSAITLPGTEIEGCHARILTGGTVLLVYALRHEADLRRMSLPEVDALDARVNQMLREADAPIFTEVLAASASSGLVKDLPLRPDRPLSGTQPAMDRRSVRYNCHIITPDPPWEPDSRVPPLNLGPSCRILLPYTYAWDCPTTTPLPDLLTMTEPTDIAVAQQSLLFGAILGGRWILVDLARDYPDNDDVHAFRRFLDGVWADYHHLDSYRVESAQGHRATYLAAREVIGLDGTEERADKLLGYVSNSLLAASAQRTQVLDTRLNRVASGLTVVAAAAFALDVVAFLLPEVPFAGRLLASVGVIALGTTALIATVRPRRRRRRATGDGAG